MKAEQRAALVSAIKQIQDLIRAAYAEDADACVIIHPHTVEVVGVESSIMLDEATPEEAVAQLEEDQP